MVAYRNEYRRRCGIAQDLRDHIDSRTRFFQRAQRLGKFDFLEAVHGKDCDLAVVEHVGHCRFLLVRNFEMPVVDPPARMHWRSSKRDCASVA